MNVLVVGSGGREHALCWALSRSPLLSRLFCAPGNGGISDVAECVALDTTDHAAVIDFCRSHRIGLVVVGPEGPLVAGIVDSLTRAGIKAFGPGAQAARLEGSKSFTKQLCARYGIPTAAHATFSDVDTAVAHIRQRGTPIVVKADGLAAGKGVTVADDKEAAIHAVREALGGRFGDAGRLVVVEELLIGEEASFFALVDGRTALPLATAQDHKRACDGDTGPNTGGMGAYSPAPVMTEETCQRTMEEIILPTVRGMAEMGFPYRGVLYAGLMITAEGPRLIEYNVRFGDPECQVLMMRLKSDLLPALLATVDGVLSSFDLRWSEETALTVVMAAKGYPGSFERGTVIGGLDEAARVEGVEMFHAGTIRDDGVIRANGGRVLNVTAVGSNIVEARERAYRAVRCIRWPQGYWRSDIGWRAIEREQGRPLK